MVRINQFDPSPIKGKQQLIIPFKQRYCEVCQEPIQKIESCTNRVYQKRKYCVFHARQKSINSWKHWTVL